MDSYTVYLELLIQEQKQLDRLLDLARLKKVAILNGSADEIAALADEESCVLERVDDIRRRRREGMSDFYSRHGRPMRFREGTLRYLLLQEAPAEIRASLSESLSQYESRLLHIRREAKINNTLLSDRLRVVNLMIETAISSAKPKEEYDLSVRKNKKSKPAASTPSMLVDQKV